jgi:adhesin/invasin
MRRLLPIAIAASSCLMGSPLKAEEVKPVVNQVSPLIAETAEGQIRYERQLPLQKSGVSGISNPKCDLFNAPRSVACVGSYEGRQPRNGFERTVMGATTLLLNEGDQIVNDPSIWAQKKAAYWAVAEGNKKINEELKKIPFLAQTTVGVNWSIEARPSFYLDSFMKLSTFNKDKDGDPKGIAFAQARYSGAPDTSGSTINLGLGTRYRIADDAMLGINGFWDHRIVSYTSPYNRVGIGLEGFWKDLEARNNWYISASGTRTLSSTATSTTYERVVPGVDVELAYRLPEYPQLAVFVKGFSWDYYSRTNNVGFAGGVNWQVSPHVNLQASVSNEVPAYLNGAPSTNNDQLYASLNLKYTFNPVVFGKRDYKKNMLTNMTQPVRRRYDVLLERYTTSNQGFSNIAAGS